MKEALVIARYSARMLVTKGAIALFCAGGVLGVFPSAKRAVELALGTGGHGSAPVVSEWPLLILDVQETMQILAVATAIVLGIRAFVSEYRANTLDLFLARPISPQVFFLGKTIGTLFVMACVGAATAIVGPALVIVTGTDVPPLYWLSLLQHMSLVCLVTAIALSVGAARSVIAGAVAMLVISLSQAQLPQLIEASGGLAEWAAVIGSLVLPASNQQTPFLNALHGYSLNPRYGHHVAVCVENILYAAFVLMLGVEGFKRRATSRPTDQ